MIPYTYYPGGRCQELTFRLQLVERSAKTMYDIIVIGTGIGAGVVAGDL